MALDIRPLSPFQPLAYPPRSCDLTDFVTLDGALARPFHVGDELRVHVPSWLANMYPTVDAIAEELKAGDFEESIEEDVVQANRRLHKVGQKVLYCNCVRSAVGERCEHTRLNQEAGPGINRVPGNYTTAAAPAASRSSSTGVVVEIPLAHAPKNGSCRPRYVNKAICAALEEEVKVVKRELTKQMLAQRPSLLMQHRAAMVAYDAAVFEQHANNDGHSSSRISSSSRSAGRMRPPLVAPPSTFVLPLVPNVPQLPTMVVRYKTPAYPYIQPLHRTPQPDGAGQGQKRTRDGNELPNDNNAPARQRSEPWWPPLAATFKKIKLVGAEIVAIKPRKGAPRRARMTTATDAARFGFAQHLGLLANGAGAGVSGNWDGDGDGYGDDDDDDDGFGSGNGSGNGNRTSHATAASRKASQVVAALLPMVRAASVPPSTALLSCSSIIASPPPPQILPLPKSTAWCLRGASIRTPDDAVLRYVPHFGDKVRS